MRRLVLLLGVAAAAAITAHPSGASPSRRVEVVVGLDAPPLARAIRQSRVLTARARTARLDLLAPTSSAYLADLDRFQQSVVRRIKAAVPSASVRWRYRIVLNGLAVVLPEDRVDDLARVPGVTFTYSGARYRVALDRSPELIGADQLWGLPSFSTAGNGMKIGIIDDGVDRTHPFFSPAGYAYPPGFPKGNTAFTTPKVIVARAFAPASTTYKYARLPFDPQKSDHGTHVAGIAAGNFLTGPIEGRKQLSGVAPRAYIGNYKALTVPTPSVGLNGNAPELAAAVEAAVRDGMDVINLSLGEPEIEPARDVLVAALNGAAAAGIVPVVAAGNSFEFGPGSISSPGTALQAITAAAVDKSKEIAWFSSGGPTPISRALKPDVSAPGVSIFSSVPVQLGGWSSFSGTSMAAPHVAGGAALLRQRHPTWTVAQIKSALVLTGTAVRDQDGREVPPTREGGGLVDLPIADVPLIFASPATVSFGLVRPGKAASKQVVLTDAGGGAGDWQASVLLRGPRGLAVRTAKLVAVPGRVDLRAQAAATSSEGEASGFVILQRGADRRRIPFWLRVSKARLGPPSRLLTKPGLFGGDTRLGRARVSSYRYPDVPNGLGIPTRLAGPEQVFRVRIGRRVANFGVRIVSAGRGVRVTPRIVEAGDENRLTGYAALPFDINPYRTSFQDTVRSVGASAPGPGAYDIVFDTPSRSTAGKFTFRLWIDDATPPKVRLVTRAALKDGRLLVAVSDRGSGIDPGSLRAQVDNLPAGASYMADKHRVLVVFPSGLAPGRHRLVLTVSDYQEAKNDENVPTILPNTSTLRTTFRVR